LNQLRCARARRSERRDAKSDAVPSVERRNEADARPRAILWGRGLLRREFVDGLDRSPRYALRPSPARAAKSPRRSGSIWSEYALGLVLSFAIPAAAEAITVKTVPGPAGVETWLSEEHALPMIAVSISLPGGSAYDPQGKAGLAALTASLMDEGAGDLDSSAFKQAMDSRAIKLSAQADRDYMVVSLTTLTENAPEAFRLLGLALAKPRFDAEAVERMRASRLADIKQEDQRATRVAGNAWFAAYFGGHPYAHPESGTAPSVESLTIADIKSFAADHLVRDRVKVAAAGDITEADLRRYLQEVIAPLPAKSVAPVARLPEPGKPGSQVIPRDEAAPVAMFGLPGPMRLDPDFIPTFVTNYIFGGGGFAARLMTEVRDKRGLTYGISTQQVDFRSASIIMGTVQSEKSKIGTALEVTKSEMARFAKDGATEKELADAKTYLTGSFPLTLDANAKIARTLNGFQRSGLGPDYVEKRNALIQAVSLAQVNAMAKKYYDPERLVVVIAGTPAQSASAQ
jgi:zinc protease